MLKTRETVEVKLPSSLCQEIGDKVHKVDTAINVLISAGLSSPSLRFLDSAIDFNAITSRGDIGIDHGLFSSFSWPAFDDPSITESVLTGFLVAICV